MSLLQHLRLALVRRKCRWPLQARLLRRALPSPRTPLQDLECIALELETGGPGPGDDQPIAAGWVLLRGDRIIMASARELRVQVRAPRKAGQGAVPHVSGASDLDDADSIAALLEHLLPELAGRAIVMHDAARGRAMLDALVRPMGGVPMPNPMIGTMALERRLLEAGDGRREGPEDPLTLDACRARRGLPRLRQYSAGTAALACAELLLAQLSLLGGAQRLRLRELLRSDRI